MWARGSRSLRHSRYASFGWTVQAIGLSLDEHGAAALAHAFHTFVGYAVDGHNIVGIDGNDGKAVVPRCLGGVLTHCETVQVCPGIILYDENYGQALFRGQCERFMPTTKSGRCLISQKPPRCCPFSSSCWLGPRWLPN